jgi:hypothetical protein
MKLLLVLMILAASVNSALGQNQIQTLAGRKCSGTAAQPPAIRGLKLGMKVDEVLREFPGSSEQPHIRQALSEADKEFGLVRFAVPMHPYRSDSRFAGVSQFDFAFLDGQVTSFGVYYAGPEWSNVDQFVNRLAESLNLPGAYFWEPSTFDSMKTLKCNGFEINVLIGAPNSVRVRNPVAEQIVKARRAEAKERARQEFKP